MGCSFLRSIRSAVSLRDRSPSQTVTVFVILVGLFVCLLRIVFLKSSNTLIPTLLKYCLAYLSFKEVLLGLCKNLELYFFYIDSCSPQYTVWFSAHLGQV